MHSRIVAGWTGIISLLRPCRSSRERRGGGGEGVGGVEATRRAFAKTKSPSRQVATRSLPTSSPLASSSLYAPPRLLSTSSSSSPSLDSRDERLESGIHRDRIGSRRSAIRDPRSAARKIRKELCYLDDVEWTFRGRAQALNKSRTREREGGREGKEERTHCRSGEYIKRRQYCFPSFFSSSLTRARASYVCVRVNARRKCRPTASAVTLHKVYRSKPE